MTPEEMIAKLTAGATTYDVIQPTNNFVAPLIRGGFVQKLDKSKLTIMDFFDPKYLNLPYDPNNDYTVPYEAGTDAIVYNSDVIKTAPTSWADLWQSGCASKNMIMLAGAHDIIGATLLSLGYDVNSKDPKQLDEAKAKGQPPKGPEPKAPEAGPPRDSDQINLTDEESRIMPSSGKSLNKPTMRKREWKPKVC
jgi:spermidine/putrescine-binding protein